MRDYKTLPTPASVWKKPSHFIAFGFGIGAIPFAPGTFGTLLAVPFYLLLQSLSINHYLYLVTFLTIASIFLCNKVTREIQVHDHPGMCLDEIVGFLITMFAAPSGWVWIIIGFLLFRFFDILKPWPIHYIDKNVKGGFGAILDDVLAGIFSCAILQILAWCFFY